MFVWAQGLTPWATVNRPLSRARLLFSAATHHFVVGYFQAPGRAGLLAAFYEAGLHKRGASDEPLCSCRLAIGVAPEGALSF